MHPMHANILYTNKKKGNDKKKRARTAIETPINIQQHIKILNHEALYMHFFIHPTMHEKKHVLKKQQHIFKNGIQKILTTKTMLNAKIYRKHATKQFRCENFAFITSTYKQSSCSYNQILKTSNEISNSTNLTNCQENVMYADNTYYTNNTHGKLPNTVKRSITMRNRQFKTRERNYIHMRP